VEYVVVAFWLLFGCLLFAVAVVILRMLSAVGYVLEYVVEYIVEYVASCWLLSVCFLVAFWLLSGCLLVAVAAKLRRMLYAVAYCVEYVVEYVVDDVVGYLASCWLFFLAFWLVSVCLLVVCCRLWLLCSYGCSLLWYIL
jgi:hypothetical protein